MESIDEFPAQLKRLRKAAGLNQTQLAERLGVGNIFVCQLETSKRRPGLDMLFQIAGVLECSVCDLLKKPPPVPKPRKAKP